MCVFFRLMFGELSYRSYDKVEDKFKYNDFSCDEYQELLETQYTVKAKKVKEFSLKGSNMMLVKPSHNNMHEFVAEENSCFFDICLPNYSDHSCRRITYFKEMADDSLSHQERMANITNLQYHTTPPKMPVDFDIKELEYRGEY
eukprot:CAMPEP_0176380582 /NCGR_PEP_ID=MMETSP0126-20121128/31247_1 /TAXON_ID=141414 ORGANISM="Strombidinopsis acuminatum, Strain SPMC142" /NCGR_SAMPLE_ID=MMETSP0126 /ASSEMBLY_ACC=CAM_ASM_000229 /LENGTH=143 /DNA_ID=CAMNT_0017743993 /DNA_START=381 /DNA_END=812 /DNA_ORIENTATION=+